MKIIYISLGGIKVMTLGDNVRQTCSKNTCEEKYFDENTCEEKYFDKNTCEEKYIDNSTSESISTVLR